jgi:hypothetical protein
MRLVAVSRNSRLVRSRRERRWSGSWWLRSWVGPGTSGRLPNLAMDFGLTARLRVFRYPHLVRGARKSADIKGRQPQHVGPRPPGIVFRSSPRLAQPTRHCVTRGIRPSPCARSWPSSASRPAKIRAAAPATDSPSSQSPLRMALRVASFGHPTASPSVPCGGRRGSGPYDSHRHQQAPVSTRRMGHSA